MATTDKIYFLLFFIALIPIASMSEPLKKVDLYMSHGTGGDKNAFSSLYKTLTKDRSIRALTLKVSQGGCVVSNDPWAFSFVKGDRFPPLEEVNLDGYDFDDVNKLYLERHKLATTGIRGWRNYLANEYDYEWLRPEPLPWVGNTPFEIIKGSNLALWREAMDWSQVKYLELKNVDLKTFYYEMSGMLPNLQKYKIVPRSRLSYEDLKSLANQTSTFITTLPSLSSLSLHSMTVLIDFPSIFTVHGSELQHLELREWEPETHLRPTLSPVQLHDINAHCPSLTSLTIDLNRNGNWPYPILDTLSTFRNLNSLTLNLELGIDQHVGQTHYYETRYGRNISEGDFRKPIVNENSGLELFRYLRDRKQGVELETLVLEMGHWGRDYGGMMRDCGWGEGLEEKWECRVDRKADGEGEELKCVRTGGAARTKEEAEERLYSWSMVDDERQQQLW